MNAIKIIEDRIDHHANNETMAEAADFIESAKWHKSVADELREVLALIVAPQSPAAFINAIAEEGTKAEAVEWLQKTWNELCEARKPLVPNQYWDTEDPETPYDSPEDWAERSWGGRPGEKTEVTFYTAAQTPSESYMIESVAAGDDTDDWNYVVTKKEVSNAA